MKGFRNTIKAGLSAGLRPGIEARNSGMLVECYNGRPNKEGLEGYTPDLNALPDAAHVITGVDMTLDWPFPQIFHTDTGIFVGNRAGLYELTVSGQAFTSSAIWTGTVVWPWTLANCPGMPVFACAEVLIYYDTDVTAWKTWTT